MLTEQEKIEYEKFVLNNERCHFAQTLIWANLKKGWEKEIVTVKDESGNIKGSVLLLIKKIPFLNSSLVTSQRGPVCDIKNEQVFSKLMKEVEKVAKKHNAFMFKIDPDISNDDMEFKELAKKNNFKILEQVKDISNVVQPRIVFRLDLKGKTEDEVCNKIFPSKTRYNIRYATKKGVTTRVGTKEDLEKFYDIMKETSKRDKFPIRTKEYFEELYNGLGNEHIRILFAEVDGKPVACTLHFVFGNKMWYMYGGSLSEHRNLKPTYLLQSESIKWAISNGIEIYDFRGVNATNKENGHKGLYDFKKSFGPELIEFTEIYKIYNPFVYFIFEKIFPIYRNIRVKFMKKNANNSN